MPCVCVWVVRHGASMFQPPPSPFKLERKALPPRGLFALLKKNHPNLLFAFQKEKKQRKPHMMMMSGRSGREVKEEQWLEPSDCLVGEPSGNFSLSMTTA